jgi:hypothetical protein
MARSAALTSGFRWPLLGLFLTLIIVSVFLPVAFEVIEARLAWWSGFWGWWPSHLVAALIECVTSAVISTAAAVSYVELRRLKEGSGVGELAEIFS